MKNKMKAFASILATLMVGSAFAGCFGMGGSSESDVNLTSEEAQKFVETYGDWSGKALEITAIDKGLGTDWLKDAARVFNKGTGASIAVKADEQLNERLASVVSTDNCSDIYFSFSAELQWIEWALSDAIVPLTDINDSLSYRNEQYAKLGVYEDVRYIMPYVYSPTGFVYNEEYIKEIPSHGEFTQGTFPTTWQGLLDMCYSINNNWKKTALGQQVVPMSWGASVDDMNYIFKGLWAQVDYEGFNNYYSQEYRASVNNDENKSLLVNDSTVKVLDSIAALLNPQQNASGKYYPTNSFSDSLGHSNRDAQQKFLNGLSVFCISGAWFENEMSEQIEDEELDFYRFASAPIINEGGKSTVFINAPSEYFMVTAKGKNHNQQLAKAFLTYMASEDATRLFHAATGVPCSLTYKTPADALSEFAKGVANVTDNSVHAIAGSNQLPSLSGAIHFQTSALFQSLATTAASTAHSTSLIQGIYDVQKADWETRFEAFNK